MPIYAREIESINKGADDVSNNIEKLRQLIAGNKQQHDLEMVKQAEGKRLDHENKMASLDRALAEQKNLPAGSHIAVDGAGISTPDPLTGFLKRQAAADRDDNQMRQETTALQAEFKRLGGNDPEKLASYDNISSMINDVNVNNVGQLRAQLARGVEKGVLTDADIARYLPTSLMGDGKKLAAYLTGGMIGSNEFGQAITPEQKAQILDDIKKKRANIVEMQKRAGSELGGRAGTLAPTLSRSGKLPQVMESLGGVAREASKRDVVKKQHNKSLNKTRVTYSDGSVEELDGLQ